MDDLMRLIVLLAFAGIAVTLLGGAVIWYMGEERRVRRGLRVVLSREPDAFLLARGRGRGVGFNIPAHLMAVTWDTGAWCLVYRIEELLGAELIADWDVVARVHRGETRRPLNSFGVAENRVSLRLVFDDPNHADFTLDLWLPSDAERRGGMSASDALQEANRWLARIEAVLRRVQPHNSAPAPAPIFDADPEVEPFTALAPAVEPTDARTLPTFTLTADGDKIT